jgi:formylmethanofuran dehydrogenase subunit E
MINMEEEFNEERMKTLLKDFGVKDEDELFQKLIEESKTLPCSSCGHEFIINELIFIDGDPICSSCIREEEEHE